MSEVLIQNIVYYFKNGVINLEGKETIYTGTKTYYFATKFIDSGDVQNNANQNNVDKNTSLKYIAVVPDLIKYYGVAWSTIDHRE